MYCLKLADYGKSVPRLANNAATSLQAEACRPVAVREHIGEDQNLKRHAYRKKNKMETKARTPRVSRTYSPGQPERDRANNPPQGKAFETSVKWTKPGSAPRTTTSHKDTPTSESTDQVASKI